MAQVTYRGIKYDTNDKQSVRSKSLNSHTEASSIQSLRLCVRGELSLTWTNLKKGLMPFFFCAKIWRVSK